MLPRAIQKVVQAIEYADSATIKIVLSQEDHFSISRYIGQYISDRRVKSVSIDGPYSVIELGN